MHGSMVGDPPVTGTAPASAPPRQPSSGDRRNGASPERHTRQARKIPRLGVDADQYGRGMGRQILTTDQAPSSPLFSQGVKAGSVIHVSGMTGTDVATGQLAGPTIQEQTRQAMRNCAAVLAAGGATLDDVVQVTVLLADPADFAGLNEAYAAMFPTDPPARAVAKLGVELPGVLVSIMITAHLDG